MVDICFDDSLLGLLVDIRKEYDSDSVRAFHFHFNYGNLSDDPIVTQAQLDAESLRYYFPNTTEIEKEYRAKLKQFKGTLEWFDTVLQNRKEIRLWVSNTAHDICNLCWLCHYAQIYSPSITIIKCPSYEVNSKTHMPEERKYWMQFSSADALHQYLDNTITLTTTDIAFYASQWDQFVKEDAALRILIDNHIVSTSADFFDGVILKHIGTAPTTQQTVMGEILEEDWGISVNFILGRVEELIKKGCLKVCQQSPDKYSFAWHRKISRT